MSQNTTSFGLEAYSSSTRTVFDIFWSCLFTIFACTWTVQHLNVPLQREELGDPGWKGDVKYAAKNFWTSAKWMIQDFENDWIMWLQKKKSRASFISNSHRYSPGSTEPIHTVDDSEVFGFILTSITFGAIHFAAITSQFPSYIEKILWCVASAICTSIILLMIFACVLADLVYSLAKHTLSIGKEDLEDRGWIAENKFLFLVILVYILARLFLIVELFRCLFFLPPSAFVSTWVSSVPHVS